MAKNWHITSGRKIDKYPVLCAMVLIVFPEFSPQPLCFHANDGIGAGIVILSTMKYVTAEGIFLKLLGGAGEGAFDHHCKKSFHLRRAAKYVAVEDFSHLQPHLIGGNQGRRRWGTRRGGG